MPLKLCFFSFSLELPASNDLIFSRDSPISSLHSKQPPSPWRAPLYSNTLVENTSLFHSSISTLFLVAIIYKWWLWCWTALFDTVFGAAQVNPSSFMWSFSANNSRRALVWATNIIRCFSHPKSTHSCSSHLISPML